MSRTEAPSLVQLCIKTAIDNLSHIRDVGDIPDIHLLKEILNKCNPDQLSQIENASRGRLTQDKDLTSVTEALWHEFYIQKFGVESANCMEQLGVPLNWRQIYEEESKEELRILVSTNTTTTTTTLAGPGCLRKSVDQIKKVCETLLKIPCGIVRCIRSEIALGIFIAVVLIIFGIGFWVIIILSLNKVITALVFLVFAVVCAVVSVVTKAISCYYGETETD